MALHLEAVPFLSQDPFLFSNYFPKDVYDQINNSQFLDQFVVEPSTTTTPFGNVGGEWQSCLDHHSSSPHDACCFHQQSYPAAGEGCTPPPSDDVGVTAAKSNNNNGGNGRRKRRRRVTKNKEEVENQRMTHIAVERNRRKQMNEYLAVIRSLMPASYVQRGDQASIVGGAINYVKELEQQLQSLDAQNRIKNQRNDPQNKDLSSLPFSDFFTFPQYSTRPSNVVQGNNSNVAIVSPHIDSAPVTAAIAEVAAAAEIEVTMVDSHANVKILAKKQPKQLLKLVDGFQKRRLSVLHLNVTSVDKMVLHSFSLKVEEGSHLSSTDDIAAAANQILHEIQEEASLII